MSRMKRDGLRSGPTAVPGGTTATAAAWNLTDITSGNANGDVVYVDVTAAFFATVNYSALVRLTCAVSLAAGPTYTLSAITTAVIQAGTDGTMYDSITLDQSGGQLRLRVTSTVHTQPFTCYATAAVTGP